VVADLASAPAAGLTLVIGLATALWSASGYVGAFGRAMNRVYEVDEGRAFVKLRGTMLAVTLLAVVIVAILAGMLVLSGPVAEAVGGLIGLSGVFLTIWDIAKWPVMVGLIIVIIAVLYYATPNVKQPKFKWMSLGSGIALFVFLLASVGFGFYVGNFGNYNKTYGALGGVIVMLLWLWILNMSLLFGAEFDAEMERGRQLQAGIKAEETIQLPPRDTKKSEKLQKQEEEDIQHGRELREKYSADNGQGGASEGDEGKADDDGTNGAQPTEPHRDRVRNKLRDRANGGEHN
jgi:membrane protein